VWLNTKFHLGTCLNDICTNRVKFGFAALLHAVKLCIRRRPEQAPSGREMQTETKRRMDADDLKKSLIA
jgi:hypothetical protein